jgi:glycosyltransferase involved in cell wall biosynthesis
MRLAILHYTKPPVVGGVERVVGEQARAMEQLGWSVWVCGAAERDVFRRRLEEGGFDAVIVHNVFTMPFDLAWTRELTGLAEKSVGVCWVNWVHDVAAVNPAYAEAGWEEPTPKAIDVAVSNLRAREWAGVAGKRVDEIVVIPNGVDAAGVLGLTERVGQLADVRKLWGSDLNLLQPSRLVRRKNVELGIGLIASLRERGVEARLIVTGAPDPHQADGRRYFEELKGLTGKLGVEQQVVFGGEERELGHDDLRSLYALCDGLFFPSWSEGFGLPLLEAKLHRLAIWCSDLPAHREVMGMAAHWFEPQVGAEELGERMASWCRTDEWLLGRRRIWREHDWGWLCKERLVPLLQAGIEE